MRLSTRLPTIALALLTLGTGGFAQEPAVPARDAALWSELERWLTSAEPGRQERLLADLQKRLVEARTATLQQLFLFSAAATDTRHGMAFGVLLERLAPAPEDVVRALVPLLETPDPALRRALAGSLAHYEDPSVERGPSFAIYRALLEEQRAGPAGHAQGLMRHLYTVDPDRAFGLFLALETRPPEAFEDRRALLLAEHVVEEARWRLRFGFATPDTLEPSALEALRHLAASPHAFARLYAARVLVLEPALRPALAAEALAEDPHALVREAVEERQRSARPR